MSLTGVGVLLIGIAFLILTIYLVRVLNNTAFILKGVGQTIEKLPHQLDGVMNEAGELIRNSNETLSDANEKLNALNPLFHIVGDLGESTRKLTSTVNDFTVSMKGKVDTVDEETRNKRLGGVYGIGALAYYSVAKGKKLKQKNVSPRAGNLYIAGEQRSFDIDRMKEEVKESAEEGT